MERRLRDERAVALLWRLAPLLQPRGLWLSTRAAVLVDGLPWRPDLLIASGLPADGILRSAPLVIIDLAPDGGSLVAGFWRDAGAGAVWEVGAERVRVHRGEGSRAVGSRDVRIPRSAVSVPVSVLVVPPSGSGGRGVGTSGRRVR